MNAILTVAALVAVVTVLEIVQAIVAHTKAKDAMKLAEAKLREEEARKSAAEIEQKSQEVKAELASTLSTLTEEQLATYNRTLECADRLRSTSQLCSTFLMGRKHGEDGKRCMAILKEERDE